MPRKARIDAPGALHHIIVRGINRRKIFFDDADRDAFLDRLGDILSDSKTHCFAWALMTNHIHLLLRTLKKLNIATSTANESVTRDRQIVAEQGLELLEEDIK
jgi:REP element-mobilizing transposase RayT